MDWDDIRIFLEVARTERLSEAAKRLRINASTVSRRLHRLETSLEVQLFERGQEGHQLTDQGRLLLATARQMEQQALTAGEILQGLGEEQIGSVRIGSTEGFGSFFITPRLADFCRQNPRLIVELLPMPRFVKLTRHEADMAVTIERPRHTSLVVTKLCDYRLKLYATEKYLQQAPALERIEDLNHHRLIGYIDDLMFSDQLNYMERLLPDAQPAFRSTSVVAQYAQARSGLGLAILPCFLAAEAPELKPVLAEEISLTRSFWLAAQPERKRLARVEAVWQELKRVTQEHQNLLMDEPSLS
ncbi:DNA-binding transcriptional regulator, LysR family [Marinospirillum celere]|uniref:DNA-binding transcriptional regulator, LysR family n=1 Tax=Marinospirillum celere TaxID=1122252 RepID=A0A1I1G7F2_9GAMM|nr:LysR family transcriptional regulator [Marinospirillum celere]SFC07475.1 DNA-binding transcriptional regulator, LysR family [Marinospirillum celere]